MKWNNCWLCAAVPRGRESPNHLCPLSNCPSMARLTHQSQICLVIHKNYCTPISKSKSLRVHTIYYVCYIALTGRPNLDSKRHTYYCVDERATHARKRTPPIRKFYAQHTECCICCSIRHQQPASNSHSTPRTTPQHIGHPGEVIELRPFISLRLLLYECQRKIKEKLRSIKVLTSHT